MTEEQKQELFDAGLNAWQFVGSISEAIAERAIDLDLNASEQELTDIAIELSIHIQTLKG